MTEPNSGNISNLSQNQFLQASHQTLLMLERSKSYVEQVLDKLPNVFAVINTAGMLIKGNEELAKLMNLNIDELIEVNINKLFLPSTWTLVAKRIADAVAVSKTGGLVEFEASVDGIEHVQVFTWQLRPFQADGLANHDWFILFGSNVTAIRAYEAQLSQIFTSIPLGILRLNEKLEILDPFSLHTTLIIGQDDLSGKSIYDVLFKPVWATLSLQQKEWAKNLSGIIGFPDFQFDILRASLVRLLYFPAGVQGAGPKGRWIGINYDPIIQNGIIAELLLILEDRTQIELAKLEHQTSAQAETIIATRFIEVQRLNAPLRASIAEDLDRFVSDLRQQASGQDILAILRTLHTIKGTARVASFSGLMSIAHKIEEHFKSTSLESQGSQAWKREIERFQQIYEEWQEYRRMILALIYVDQPDAGAFISSKAKQLFADFEPRIQLAVENTAKTLGKQVLVKFKCSDLAYPPAFKAVLSEALLHIVSNAVDHGIEEPEKRIDLGKSPHGLIEISASHHEKQLVIVVSNDGAALNRQKIAAAGLKLGIIDERQAETLDDATIFNLIFSDKLSSKAEVTAVSGRGVGLSAVKASVEALGGLILVRQRSQGGTEFELRLPITEPEEF